MVTSSVAQPDEPRNHDPADAPTLAALRAYFEAGLSRRAGPKATLLFVALAYHLGSDGWAWPGYGRLEDVTGLHRRHFARALQTLERLGVLQRDAHHGRRTRYRIVLTGATPVTSSNGGTSTPGGTTTGSNGGTTGGSTGGTRTDHITAKITDHQYLAPRVTPPSAAAPPPPKRKRARKANDSPDPRVQPVLREFRDGYVAKFGVEPTTEHLDYGRDGRRIRRQPKSLTAEVMVEAVRRFFAVDDPYIVGKYRFEDYLRAIPRLMRPLQPAANGRRVHLGPDHRDPARYDTWG